MATYVNNLRLKEITTGDEDGTWGTSTNTNLELIGEGFGYGTQEVAADANETFTMADGAADGVRGMYLKFTSAGSLSATRELTLAPNTVSKVWIIENATTGSQIITIKQGAGATVNVASGAKKMVYTDGVGSGAAVFDADPTAAGGGTVTSVGTSGTVNGITLTGTVTTSGSLVLGGTLGSVSLTSQITGTLPVGNGGTGITSLGTGVAGWLGTPSSANLATAVTDETGSGSLVFATSPTFVTPVLGTPASGTATNLTGLPPAGVTGTAAILGANTFTALQILSTGANIASATAVDLTGATGNAVVITGTTPSTSLTMTAGQQMVLLPSAAWPLTYHATTMNINGGVSYTCAAGDRVYAVKDLANVIRVSVFKQDGTSVVAGAASSVAVGDITGAGTGVLTALAVNVGSAGAPVVLGGALGTPSSGTLTSATGLPISTGVSGLASNVATFLGTSSSANLASAVTDETGSGSLTFATSPTFVTPTLGAATATSVNKFVFTAPSTAATINTRADNLTHSMPAITGNLTLEQLQQNSQSAAYTTVLADAGKQILHPSSDTTARVFTIDSNANVAYVIGTAITFVNQVSAGVVTIAITSDTMRLAGDGTTGSRTLAADGVATALKIETTNWIISGVGLT